MLHARFGLDRMVLQQVMAKAGLVGRTKGKSRAGVGMVSSCCTSWGKRRPSASNTTLDGTPESPAYKRGHWQRKPNRSNAPSAEVIIRAVWHRHSLGARLLGIPYVPGWRG